MTNQDQEKKKGHFDSREWFRQEVEKRTYSALRKKNKQFVVDHAKDSREMLIEYLQECANELEHSPDQKEVIGGDYIAYRFDGWSYAIREAALPKPRRVSDRKRTRLFKEEYKQQSKLFMNELRTRKEQRNKDSRTRKETRMAEKEARLALEKVWAEEHRGDTDEQLLLYVQQCAEELGFTPYRKNVLGSDYIAGRFGGWYATLSLAKLPIPEDRKEPSRRKKHKIKVRDRKGE